MGVYSLVNAPVVAFDAGRLPSGSAFAADLVAALLIDSDRLTALESVARNLPPRAADRSGQRVFAAALADLRTEIAGHSARALNETAQRLLQTPFADRGQVAEFVRRDVLDWTCDEQGTSRWPHAVALIGDIVAASHAGDLRESPERVAWARLRPDDTARTGLPPAADDRLAELGSRLTVGLLRDLDVAHERRRATATESWALLVHFATRALFVTDRLRAAAVAQLRAAMMVRAVHPGPAPLGALSAISGAVHAWAVEDILDEPTFAGLVGPLEAVLTAR